jgi:hypothetical protein
VSADVDQLAGLDPDDPRTPSQQIANAIRAAILRGTYAPGEKLPSQHTLVARFGVARETVKSALRILDSERLIVSRQGSGSFVRTRQGDRLDLEGLLRSAFDRPDVSIDYAGFRAETLSHTLPPSLHDIAAGRLTARSLRLRLLIVDPKSIVDFPRPVDGRPTDRALRRVHAGITDTAINTLTDEVAKLTRARLLRHGTVEVRVHGLGPVIKCYLLNGERALIGFYPSTTYSLEVRGESVPMIHPSGWDAFIATPDDAATYGPPFAEQARSWFESIWSTVARPYQG